MADEENKDPSTEEEVVEEKTEETPSEGGEGAEAEGEAPKEGEAKEDGEAAPEDAAAAEGGEEEEMDDATREFLEAGKKDEEAKAAAATATDGEAAPEGGEEEEMDDATREFLEAGKKDEAAKAAAAGAAEPAKKEKPDVDVQPVSFSNLTGSGGGSIGNMDMILDIPVTVSVELGKTRILINELLSLGQGSVVELNKLAGEPMEIMVNGKLIARGEVVVVNEKFGVRLTDIISVSERIGQLG
jgi:flagellar motor switch protein FliN/FliY